MLFRQVLHDDLGCASYVVADGGRAIVVDPRWDVAPYLRIAREQALQLVRVLETHDHADHVSGHGRLAAATGAPIAVSSEAGVAYAHEPLRDGDVLELGAVRIHALATPGHRPEHLAYAVEDRTRAERPWLVLSGDSLLVGDLARPDLAVDPREGARALFASLRRLVALGDEVELWPAHVGGSLCGGAGTSGKPSSTIGFERRANRLLAIADEEAFVRELLAGLAPQPPAFERIVALNRGPLLAVPPAPVPLAPARLAALADEGVAVLDARDPREFDGAHVPGSLNVTAATTGFGTRAAWAVEPGAPVALVTGGDSGPEALAELLAAVGLRNVRGHLAGGIGAWREAGRPLATTPALDVATLAARLRAGEVALLDVRERDEWKAGHVPGSLHVPFHELRDGRVAELEQAGRPLAVACTSGVRSALAASLLRRAGVDGVVHVADGGVEQLDRHGVELTRG
jgi:hydroxyacylglutathione hydrolase